MITLLDTNSILTTGKYRGKTVSEVLENDKREILNLIRQGISFNDEVLSLAGIKKSIRNVKVVQICTEHEKDNKVYQKETQSLSKILKELRTIDNIAETVENEKNDYISVTNDKDFDDNFD